MAQSGTSVRSAPYGLAFPIDDLVRLRAWAEQRKLQMKMLLDSVVDGAEFEELLVVASPGSTRRTLTVWRTRTGLFAQTPATRPHEFTSMESLLADLRPARTRRPSLRRRLGLG